MEIYRIGDVIREERIRRGITQETLCEGICAVVTLSRIENNTQKPRLNVEKALLERLGCSTENLVFYASKTEVQKHQLEVDMSVLAMHKLPIHDKLSEYRSLLNTEKCGSDLEKQFADAIEAIYGLYSGEWELQKVSCELIKSLEISIPGFAGRGMNAVKLLTHTEMMILNNLALVLYKQGKISEAVDLIAFLISYMRNSYLSVEIKGKEYPMLLLNMVKMLKRLAKYEEMLTVCEEGVKFCNDYARLGGLPDFYYYHAVALEKLHRIDEADSSYEYAIRLYHITENPKLVKRSQEKKG